MTSIRRYLLTVLVSTLTLIIFIATLQGYRQSMTNTGELFDVELKSISSLLAVATLSNKIITLEKNSFISFQIWQANQLIMHSSHSPTFAIAAFKEGYSEKNFSGFRWRTYSLYQAKQNKWIFVAQKFDNRVELAEKVILASVYPVIISLPIAAILIWFILTNGLKPLNSIKNQLTLRKADNLNPIQIDSPPSELQTVINTINHLLNRLKFSFEREKRFASDAAHELRTPLSVLKVNLHNLEKEIPQETENLTDLKQGTTRMSHVVDQILTLYRTTPDQFSAQFERVDLYQLSQQVIMDDYPQISAKYQTIELLGVQSFIKGEPFALTSLLRNLISNANKYTPEEGQILVCIERHNDSIIWSIEDSGEGIPEHLHKEVFQRFYRVGGDRHKSGVQGCGLGLSIVQHIVDLHHASINLSHSKYETGLKVSIIFSTSENNSTESNIIE